jgi:hypothetical protein
MDVWILTTSTDYEGTTVLGIFSNFQRARDEQGKAMEKELKYPYHADKEIKEWHKEGNFYTMKVADTAIVISKFEVDKEAN